MLRVWEEIIAHLLPLEAIGLDSPIVNNKLMQTLVLADLLLYRQAAFTQKKSLLKKLT